MAGTPGTVAELDLTNGQKSFFTNGDQSPLSVLNTELHSELSDLFSGNTDLTLQDSLDLAKGRILRLAESHKFDAQTKEELFALVDMIGTNLQQFQQYLEGAGFEGLGLEDVSLRAPSPSTQTHGECGPNREHPSKTSTEKPSTEKPSTESPSTESPSTESPSTESPSTESPSTEKPSTEKPSTEKPSTEKPSTEKPSTEKPSTEKPSTEKPSTEKPSTEKPSTEKPSTEKPSTEKPSTEKPSTEKPTNKDKLTYPWEKAESEYNENKKLEEELDKLWEHIECPPLPEEEKEENEDNTNPNTTPVNNNTGNPNTYKVDNENAIVISETIVVKAGETFDGKGKTYTASSALGDGGQGESQKPLFILEDGAKLVNVVLGKNEADGIHTYGDATLDNIHWTDVGEDALTMKASGNVTITNSSAENASDKIFQLNAAGTLTIDNFYAKDFGKLVRTNGGQQGDWDIRLSNITAINGENNLVRSDSTTVKLTVSNISMTNVNNPYQLPASGELIEK